VPSVYLAGKMFVRGTGHDVEPIPWRDLFFNSTPPDLNSNYLPGEYQSPTHLSESEIEYAAQTKGRYPIRKNAIDLLAYTTKLQDFGPADRVKFDYVGPFFWGRTRMGCYQHGVLMGVCRGAKCEFGMWEPHGGGCIGSSSDYSSPFFDYYIGEHSSDPAPQRPWIYGCPEPTLDTVMKRSLEAIQTADLVIGVIDSPDCYGTLYELAYAAGLGKKIHVAHNKFACSRDMWFPLSALGSIESGDVADCVKALKNRPVNLWSGVEEAEPSSEGGCYLYVIKSGDSAYKVGISGDPITRLKQLQTGNHNRLSLMLQQPFKTKAEAQRMEAKIHAKIRAYNSAGEWFKISSGILGAIVFECLEE